MPTMQQIKDAINANPALLAAMAECCCGSGSGSGGDCTKCCFCHGRREVDESGNFIPIAPASLQATIDIGCMGIFTVTLYPVGGEGHNGQCPWLHYQGVIEGPVDGSCISCITGLGISWADAGRLTIDYQCTYELTQNTCPEPEQYLLQVTAFDETHAISAVWNPSLFESGSGSGSGSGGCSFSQLCQPFIVHAQAEIICGLATTACQGQTSCANCVGSTIEVTITI